MRKERDLKRIQGNIFRSERIWTKRKKSYCEDLHVVEWINLGSDIELGMRQELNKIDK
jgi:hypothetical protein